MNNIAKIESIINEISKHRIENFKFFFDSIIKLSKDCPDDQKIYIRSFFIKKMEPYKLNNSSSVEDIQDFLGILLTEIRDKNDN